MSIEKWHKSIISVCDVVFSAEILAEYYEFLHCEKFSMGKLPRI